MIAYFLGAFINIFFTFLFAYLLVDDAMNPDVGSRDRRHDVTGHQEDEEGRNGEEELSVARRQRPPGDDGRSSRTWKNSTAASALRLLVYQLTSPTSEGPANRQGLHLPLRIEAD